MYQYVQYWEDILSRNLGLLRISKILIQSLKTWKIPLTFTSHAHKIKLIMIIKNNCCGSVRESTDLMYIFRQRKVGLLACAGMWAIKFKKLTFLFIIFSVYRNAMHSRRHGRINNYFRLMGRFFLFFYFFFTLFNVPYVHRVPSGVNLMDLSRVAYHQERGENIRLMSIIICNGLTIVQC